LACSEFIFLSFFVVVVVVVVDVVYLFLSLLFIEPFAYR
jgi:hypothetical protein